MRLCNRLTERQADGVSFVPLQLGTPVHGFILFHSNADFLKLFFWNPFPASKLALRGGSESVCLLPYFLFNAMNTGFISRKVKSKSKAWLLYYDAT